MAHTRTNDQAQARSVLFISIGVTLALILLPIGESFTRPLLLIGTLIHELGHGVAAILMGQEFHKFVMHWDGSGQALVGQNTGAAGRAFIAAGGLVGPAVGATVLFVMARRVERSRLTLIGVGVLLLVAEIMVVRNGFGLAFVGIFAAVCIGIGIMGSDKMSQLTLVFLAVQLALSVYVGRHYLFMKSAGVDANGNVMNSDSQAMANAMGLPYWFWGGVCAVVSAALLLVGAYYFLRADKSKKPSKKKPTPSKTI